MGPVVVLDPSPLLTVTVERQVEDGRPRDEVHVHAGGQGCWIARMLTVLGVDTVVCAPVAGETGELLDGLMRRDGYAVERTEARTENACYVDDRRSGDREQLVRTDPVSLSRHDVDDLCTAFRSRALTAPVAVLTGASYGDVLPHGTFQRLAADLTNAECKVVTDLAGRALTDALAGGVHLVKGSDQEFTRDGLGADPLEWLTNQGAHNAVVSSATGPTRARLNGSAFEAQGPAVQPADGSGTGDAMTAGLVAGIVRGCSAEEMLRLGVAAGSLNAGRHGRGSGRREDVERVAASVRVRVPISVPAGDAVVSYDDLDDWVDLDAP